MPAKKRPKPLYQRGDFRLYARPGRNHEIIWYDTAKRRERSVSAGTTDVRQASIELDRRYLEAHGQPVCPTCHRAWDGQGPVLVADAIADYLITISDKPGLASARQRLAHVISYLVATNPATHVAMVDEAWVARFRAWRAKQNYRGKTPSLSHIEGSVMQLAAAINATGTKAHFKARPLASVAQTPTYRADITMLAAMFAYALERPERENLLRFLRASVATWARPDAIYDIHASQWVAGPRILMLNPQGRIQTKKHRPTIAIAKQFAPHLDALMGEGAQQDVGGQDVGGLNAGAGKDQLGNEKPGDSKLGKGRGGKGRGGKGQGDDSKPGKSQPGKGKLGKSQPHQHPHRHDGAYIRINTVRGAWDAMRKALGLPSGVSGGTKLIRRSMATLGRLRLGEADWVQGRMMLGHIKATTSDIYALPNPAHFGKALAVTEAIITEIEALTPGAFANPAFANPALTNSAPASPAFANPAINTNKPANKPPHTLTALTPHHLQQTHA